MVWEANFKNSKDCFTRYPNTSKSVKKTRLCLIFSTHFSGFGYPDGTLFLVFDILLENCFKTDIILLCVITGLPLDMKEEEFIEMMSKYGIIMQDPDTSK